MPTSRDPPGFYALEKLTDAVGELKTDRPVKERLGWARTRLTSLQRKDIPDDGLANELLDLKARLSSREPAGDEGAVVATLGVLTDEECYDLARRVIELRERLDHLLTG